MTNRFLISAAAAALIATTGFANAQGTGTTREAPASGGAAAQHSAPAGGAASGTMNRDAGSAGGTKSSEQSAPAGRDSMNRDSADKAQAQPDKTGKSAQDTNAPNQPNQKSKMSSDNDAAKSKDMKADGRSGNTNADSKGATESRSQTTGNAATSAKAPPAEKRTQISSAIKSERVESVTNVNFNISVGTAVPSSVRFHALPPRIVEIYPEWSGYEFILVNGRYVIVQPETHEIVYIIEG